MRIHHHLAVNLHIYTVPFFKEREPRSLGQTSPRPDEHRLGKEGKPCKPNRETLVPKRDAREMNGNGNYTRVFL